MSRLVLSGTNGREFKLNVTQFRSPMSAQITTAQTRTMVQHFPIRCGQPDIQFTCQFVSQEEKHKFQNFVREHQIKSLDITENWAEHVTLFWPQRNIENWTGYISTYKVLERRFEYAPVVTFGVDLVDSLMSTRTTVSSSGSGFGSILGIQIPDYVDLEDAIIKPVSRLINQLPGWGNFGPFGPQPTAPTTIEPGGQG